MFVTEVSQDKYWDSVTHTQANLKDKEKRKNKRIFLRWSRHILK
jgi:hypothetical protein